STASSVTFTAAAGAVISCDFTNTKRPAISVLKTAVGGDGTFEFTLTGDGGSMVPVSTTNGVGSYVWDPAGLTPGGTYTLTESVKVGWVSTFTACSGVEVTSSTSSSVTFTAPAGAEISCRFTNTKVDETGVLPVVPGPTPGTGIPITGGVLWGGITATGLLLSILGFLLIAAGRRRRTLV
ncbi:MAG TPA: hypothetical protein PLP26_03290, partial [Ilumatobacteraceae bacterium]|nr:hypothetical protein [Ilumatobacteraceae bacterium]